MKFIILFAALFAVALAAPAAEVETVRNESEVEPEHFKFAVETSDGAGHSAEGVLGEVGTDHETIRVHGSYHFVAADGQTYTVEYVADENGFQPKGAHLPVAPVA